MNGCFMFVCSCNMLTDTDIDIAVSNGATHPREVYAAKGCKAQCGNCVPGVLCLLRRALRQAAHERQGAVLNLAGTGGGFSTGMTTMPQELPG